MSLYKQGTDLPDDGTDDLPLPAQVKKTVQALEENRGPIQRWFWKGLVAFNLVLWSVTLCISFLLWVA